MNVQFIQEMGILFVVIALLSFLVKFLRQPIIIGYVLSGLIVSFFIPLGSRTGEQIQIMSEIGITFLLFLIGLELDISRLKQMGKDILIVTLLPSLIFFGISLAAASLLGFNMISSVYLAILCMFSSTLLVVKWVEDKKETSTVTGKLIIGTLIMQDLLAIASITILNIFNDFSWVQILLFPVKGIILLLIAYVMAKYVLNRLLRFATRFIELLFTFSLSICFFFAFITPFFGYSSTIGAFIAGVMLANTEYKNDVYVRLKPLILFFNILFFVGFGFRANQEISLQALYVTVLLLLLSLLIKPIIYYLTLKFRGYDMKTSVKVGVSLSQVSEFGLIIVFGGMASGILPQEMGAIAVMLVVMAMMLSSYYIKHSNQIYEHLKKYLQRLDNCFKHKYTEDSHFQEEYQVVFFGFQEFGRDIFSKLEGLGKKIMVVENDPANISNLKNENIPFVYNSLTSPYFFEHFNFKNTELIISSLVDAEDNKFIINQVKAINPKSVIIVTAKNIRTSLDLYNAGADYVIYSSYLNEQNVTILIEDYTTDINKIITKKAIDLKKLEEKNQKLNSAPHEFNINNYLKWLDRKLK